MRERGEPHHRAGDDPQPRDGHPVRLAPAGPDRAQAAGLFLELLVPSAALSLVRATLARVVPRLATIELDWRVLVYTGLLVIGIGASLGLVAARHISRAQMAETLRAGSRGSSTLAVSRFRGLLIVAEIAVASLLVVSAGLLLRSLAALSAIDPGFRSERVMTGRIMPASGLCDDATRCLNFYRQVLDSVTSSTRHQRRGAGEYAAAWRPGPQAIGRDPGV